MEGNLATGVGSRMAAKTIYKICSKEEWETAVMHKRFEGAAIDLQDGFIHFSTATQVKETARLHFKECEGLVLVAVNVACLAPNLKWETSRGGDLFPHLFATLDVGNVKSVTALHLAGDGLHIFPNLED